MKPIAILCSDLHLSLHPPACRKEKDWLEVQERYLRWLRKLAGGVPIICAGDIFDKWNVPPELIRFALENLPDGMICVPGQHDLPNHRLDQMHRSGYGVLAAARKIVDLSPESRLYYSNGEFVTWGFGWGAEIKACAKADLPRAKLMSQIPQIAVIHKYIWLDAKSKYPGAPDTASFGALKKVLQTYDAAVIGDNHKSWLYRNVINTGCFIRRKSDEIPYTPCIATLFENGTVVREHVPCGRDEFYENTPQREEVAFNLKDFIDSLEKLGEHGLDFREAVKNHLRDNKDIGDQTKDIILRALDNTTTK